MKRLLLLIAVCLSLQMANTAFASMTFNGYKLSDEYSRNSSSSSYYDLYKIEGSTVTVSVSDYYGMRSLQVDGYYYFNNPSSATGHGYASYSFSSSSYEDNNIHMVNYWNFYNSVGTLFFIVMPKNCYEDIYYYLDNKNKTASVAGSNRDIKSLIIPESVVFSDVEYTVTDIGMGAFVDNTSLEYISIPKTITSINDIAFKGCNNLKEIIFEEGNEELILGGNTLTSKLSQSGQGLFFDCPLNKITLGRPIKYAFQAETTQYSPFKNKSNLKTITIQNNIQEIWDSAFEGCINLEEIIIPGSITHIGTDAFKNTSTLKKVNLLRGDEELTVSNPFTNSGVDYLFLGRDVKGTLGMGTALKTLQVGSNVNYIDANQFKGCSNLESVNIFAGNLATIKANAFEDCKTLTEITIPNNVETIEAGAFKSCSALETVNLPIKLTEIADETFESCYKLKNITLPQGITVIGKSAFQGADFSSINLPEGLTEIKEKAFGSAYNLNQLSFPSTLKKIGNGAFAECAFTELIIPDNVETLGESAFYECNDLKYVKLSNNLKTIPLSAFAECDVLEEVELPNNLEIIEDYAFGDSPLESIDLPVTLTSIGSSAFYGNNFQELTIPVGVKTIGANAFANNTGLLDIYSLSTVPPTCADASAFDAATKKSARLFVPASAVEDYMSYICWKDFTYYEPLTALNTIEIHGETDRLRVNKTLDLTLTVTPDDMTSVKVVWSSSNPAVATVDQTGHVTALSQGFTVISAKAQDIVAAEGIYPITVINYLIGDSNESDSVTITDAVNIASYVMGQEPDVFNFDASDVNENGVITLADASGVISIVLDELGSAQPSNSAMRKAAANHDGKLVARSNNNPAETSILLDADREMTALQADIKAAEGQKIEDIIISDDISASHSLISKRISDNEIRVVLYSPALNILPENPASLFTVKTSRNSVAAIDIDNILATGSDFNEYELAFEGGTTTSIEGNFSDRVKVTAENGNVTVSNATGMDIHISDLNGMTVAAVREACDIETFNLNAGIYIVTVVGKAYKIAVR